MTEPIEITTEPVDKVTEPRLTTLPKLQLKHHWAAVLSTVVAAFLLMLIWWNFRTIGLRLPLSVLIVGGLLVVNTFLQQRDLHPSSIFLFIIAIVNSLIPSFRAEGVTVAVSILATIICLFLLVVDFLNGQWWQYRLREYVKPIFMSVAAFFVGLPTLLTLGVQSSRAQSGSGEHKRYALGVLKGVLIALPILLIFVLLFASADLIFENRVNSFLTWWRDDSMKEIFSRFLLTFLFMLLLSAALWMTFSVGRKKVEIEPDKPLIKPFLGMTETSIVLISINLLFAFFLLIQFRYFFAGEANISAAGFTYAEYARKGFVELLIVAGLAGLIYYGLASFTRRESERSRKLFSILGGLLLAQVGVVLVSAYQRIGLYTGRYGLTEIRLVPRIFTIFLAGILISLVVMEAKKKFKHLAMVLLSALVLFSFTLALVNIDKTIARTNLERASPTSKIDYGYLVSRLSNDAVPYLYQTLEAGHLSEVQQSNLAKVLACRVRRMGETIQERGWLDWSFPESRTGALNKEYADSGDYFPASDWEVYGDSLKIGDDIIYCKPFNWE